MCQLDVVYIDNNKKNKNNTNLRTLCANCNRVYKKTTKENKKSILDITVDTDYRL
jgi:5-methylcytosine-specific restriction endonuclease McrA